MTPEETRALIREAEERAAAEFESGREPNAWLLRRLTDALAALTTPQECGESHPFKNAACVLPQGHEPGHMCAPPTPQEVYPLTAATAPAEGSEETAITTGDGPHASMDAAFIAALRGLHEHREERGLGAMTTTPNPTAEQIVIDAYDEIDNLDFSNMRAQMADVAVAALRAHGLLSEGAAIEEQIEARTIGLDASTVLAPTKLNLTIGEHRVDVAELADSLIEAGENLRRVLGVSPVYGTRQDIDEAALAEVISTAQRCWRAAGRREPLTTAITRAVITHLGRS